LFLKEPELWLDVKPLKVKVLGPAISDLVHMSSIDINLFVAMMD
jgi:hypothetical protein